MESIIKSLLCSVWLISSLFGGGLQSKRVETGGIIVIGGNASPMESYAARELQRYIYQISGSLLEITSGAGNITAPTFLLGQSETNLAIKSLVDAHQINVSRTDPGPQGYVLKKLQVSGQSVIVIAGSDDVGCLYGVYGLLEDHYMIGFYLGGDVLPDKQSALAWPDVDERKVPTMYIRGFLPWTNFPQSATVYSWEDWKFIIDQMAKMRLNFINIHNYNGELGHNEMYHNFTLNGFTSRVWMATARTGHKWACPPWDVNKYLFGASDLFDDYDFGADCALHNETLSNDQIFRKSVSLFQKVIAYAHTRGVKVGLGLDIDLIPPEYYAKADDPRVVSARVDQLARDYPNLDYVLCFQSEIVGKNEGFYRTWRTIFDGFYRGITDRMPRTRIAVAGWGLEPASIATLPRDVICAPISYYSDKCESGAIYGDREYWGCPWLERDFNSSEYYYPYNMNLSNTIEAYDNRAPNMKGFYCLTWRLTDAVEAKMWYVSKAPWDDRKTLTSSKAVYHDYAVLNYGKEAADEITAIINQNEPYASDFGECRATPGFDRDQNEYLLNIRQFKFNADDSAKTLTYLASNFSAQDGIQRAPSSEGGECVGYINAGDWIRFDSLKLPVESSMFEARIASATDGGTIELRLDSLGGALIGTLAVSATGDWQKWQTQRIAITAVKGQHRLFMRFRHRDDIPTEYAKALAQIATIDAWIARSTSSSHRHRLGLLRSRIGAAKAHIELNDLFEHYRWEDLPGATASWTSNFVNRVSDISSLGNVMSMQNRFIQLNYVAKENTLRSAQLVKAPSSVLARGTCKGAVVSWKNEEPNAVGFNVYRSGRKLNVSPLPYSANTLTDNADGSFKYTVTAVNTEGIESPSSVPAACSAGNSDKIPPRIVIISPPGSVPESQAVWVKARVLDNRTHESITATIFFRTPGQFQWIRRIMQRKTKSVFTAQLSANDYSSHGLEYYIEATDGDNVGVYPVSAPGMTLQVTVYGNKPSTPPESPIHTGVKSTRITWSPPASVAHWYKIYRGTARDFKPGPSNFVTYVDAKTTSFRDGAEDFGGKKLKGTYYYKVTAVDALDNESAPSSAAKVSYGK